MSQVQLGEKTKVHLPLPVTKEKQNNNQPVQHVSRQQSVWYCKEIQL